MRNSTIVVTLLFASACSFAASRPPVAGDVALNAAQCRRQDGLPAADVAGGVLLAVAAVGVMALMHEAANDQGLAGPFYAVGMAPLAVGAGAGSLVYGGSAIYGYHNNARCDDVLRQQQGLEQQRPQINGPWNDDDASFVPALPARGGQTAAR